MLSLKLMLLTAVGGESSLGVGKTDSQSISVGLGWIGLRLCLGKELGLGVTKEPEQTISAQFTTLPHHTHSLSDSRPKVKPNPIVNSSGIQENRR